jgi:uncharacterized membrane protein SirB2
MSKSTIGVFVSALVSGAIAGGSIALYRVVHESRLSVHLSQNQAALAATAIAVAALCLVVYVLRWFPDQNKDATTEQSMLAVISGIATLAMVTAGGSLLMLAPTMTQLWLVPAIVCLILAAILSVLPIGLGVLRLGEQVPDFSPAKGR